MRCIVSYDGSRIRFRLRKARKRAASAPLFYLFQIPVGKLSYPGQLFTVKRQRAHQQHTCLSILYAHRLLYKEYETEYNTDYARFNRHFVVYRKRSFVKQKKSC